MPRPTNELKQVKDTVKKLKRLYGLLIEKYMATLEGGGEVNASMLSEIGKFLSQNGVTLQNMVKLDILETLKTMDSRIKGDLDSMTRTEEDEWKARAEESLKGLDLSDIQQERREKRENGTYGEHPMFNEQLQ